MSVFQAYNADCMGENYGLRKPDLISHNQDKQLDYEL
jgi:hypothetical protein